ncbi:MAG: hypothetical protein JXR76_17095 [Deltaproteobacteria bacterium]|nr:hypothetical protein [Deltaproteobacteria bacterium]
MNDGTDNTPLNITDSEPTTLLPGTYYVTIKGHAEVTTVYAHASVPYGSYSCYQYDDFYFELFLDKQ